MTFQRTQSAYAQSVGSTPTNANYIATRNPGTTDTNFPIGQFWQNTDNESLWYLNSFSTSGGVLQAAWVNIESTLATLSDTADTPVSPSSSLSTPPNNIQLTNLDGTIDILSDAVNNRIIISTSDTGDVQTLTPNSGTSPVTPLGGTINVYGTGSLTTVGSSGTVTAQLTGLTNHSVLVGAGTATITKVAPSATSGVPLVSNGSSADPSFTTAQVVGGGTGNTAFTANSLLLGNGTSPISALGLATNGQLPIGSTGTTPVLATLTQGSNITITNGAGSITLDVPTGGGLSLAAFGSTPNANGLTLSSGVLNMEPASGSFPGGVSTTTQTFAGAKTFTNTVASGVAGSSIGGFLLSGNTSGTISILPQAAAGTFNFNLPITAGTSGYLLTSAGGGASAMTWTDPATLSGVLTMTGDTGGALSPTAGNMNTLGSGSITISGSGSTLTTQLTGLTNHSVLVGAGTTTITKVAPSATSGIPLVSNGSSADPSFTTAVVAGGGTGNTTFTAYSVICAGTTATGPFQNVSGLGSSGQVLKSNGAGALPTWQTDSAGSLVLISTQTASASANISFTSLTTYQNLILVMNGVQPATNTAVLNLLVSQDGATYLTTGYTAGINYNAYNSSVTTNSNSTAAFVLSGPQNNAAICSGNIFLHNFNVGQPCEIEGQCNWTDTTLAAQSFGRCGGQSSTGIVAIRIQFSSGNITSGTFSLYGIAT